MFITYISNSLNRLISNLGVTLYVAATNSKPLQPFCNQGNPNTHEGEKWLDTMLTMMERKCSGYISAVEDKAGFITYSKELPSTCPLDK